MTNSKKHVQCKLEYEGKTTIRWLPEKYAEVGKSVVISEGNTEREFWNIIEVYNALPSDYINDRSQDYKRTRKASDV